MEIFTLFLYVFVSCGTFFGVDQINLPLQKGEGQIVSRTFTPARTIERMVMSTSHSIPYGVDYPDLWEIEVAVDGMKDSIRVKEKFYNRYVEGDYIMVAYYKTRLSNSIILKHVYYWKGQDKF